MKIVFPKMQHHETTTLADSLYVHVQSFGRSIDLNEISGERQCGKKAFHYDTPAQWVKTKKHVNRRERILKRTLAVYRMCVFDVRPHIPSCVCMREEESDHFIKIQVKIVKKAQFSKWKFNRFAGSRTK